MTTPPPVFPEFESDLGFPIGRAWFDFVARVTEKANNPPPEVPLEHRSAYTDAIWHGSMVAGIASAIGALESQLYEIRMAMNMNVETQLDPPGPWTVPSIDVAAIERQNDA